MSPTTPGGRENHRTMGSKDSISLCAIVGQVSTVQLQRGHSHPCSDCVVLSHSSRVRLFTTPWTVAHQAPLSMGILQARILE